MAADGPVLVLGGGAARALAHLGVFAGLEAHGVRPKAIVGTSMGAILGAAYAVKPDASALIAAVAELLQSERFGELRKAFLKETKRRRGGLVYSVRNLVRRGVAYGSSTLQPTLVSAEAFADSMGALIPPGDLTDSEIPFRAVALDIDSGEEIVMRRGDRRLACRASAAIPGVLPSVERNGRTLIDGGWIDKVPILPARAEYSGPLLAVDITEDIDKHDGPMDGLDMFVRANAIRDARLIDWVLRAADLAIEPAVKDVHWADFGAIERCVKAGREAVEHGWSAWEGAARSRRLRDLWPGRAARRRANARRTAEALGIRWD